MRVYRIWYEGGGMVEIITISERAALVVARALIIANVSHVTDVTSYTRANSAAYTRKGSA